MIKKFDIAVIGGGPSGSASSLLLSEEGFSVCLTEKRPFPREVLCGEFISHEVTKFLSTHDLMNKFLSFSPNEINSFALYNGKSNPLKCSLGFKGFGLRRSKLDNLLLNAAIQAGTELFQPAEVIDITKREAGFRIRIKDNAEEIEVYARTIICAYGKQNILDKKLNRPFHNIKSGLNGIKYHIHSPKIEFTNPDEIQIYTADNIYCGINKVDSDLVTLCYLEKKDKKTSSKEKLKTLYDTNLHFREIIPDLSCITEESTLYGTGNIYFGKRNLAYEGIFFTGDAAAVIAPLAGDGIGMAIESAEIVSSVIKELLNGKIDIQTASTLYNKEYKKKLSSKLRSAYAAQSILLNSFLRIQAVNLAKLFPALLGTIIKHTRS